MYLFSGYFRYFCTCSSQSGHTLLLLRPGRHFGLSFYIGLGISGQLGFCGLTQGRFPLISASLYGRHEAGHA